MNTIINNWYYQFWITATIWDPYYHNAVHRTKMLQNHTEHLVLNCPWRRYCHDSVSSMISTLKWQPLQTRRRNARLILLFKIFHDYQTMPHQYLPTQAPLNIKSNHNQNLQHYQSKTNVAIFFLRTVPFGNGYK